MRKEYDFSRSQKNPYAKHLQKQVTLRVEDETVAYFKRLADEMGITYQQLMKMYLADCVHQRRQLKMEWG